MTVDPMTPVIGDVVQYVWGMPGPEYDEGYIVRVHDDGSFDIQMGPETYGGEKLLRNKRLSDRNGPVYVGYCAKVTRRSHRGEGE